MIDSQLLSNFTELTSELLAVNSTIATQFLSVSATLSMIDSSLLSNFTSITATLTAMGSNITTNYLAITAELALIDSSLASNFTLIMAKIVATNSSIITQTLQIITNLEYLNATMYLIDDPAHLNPLVLGHSLSDEYCDLTIVSSWHNATISIYDNDVLMEGPTSELLCPIRYTLLGGAGRHNLSVFVDGGNDSFWYNISYTVALDVAIEDWGVEDVVIEIVGVSNADVCWWVYNEGIYSGETGIETEDIGFYFTFAKNAAVGKHNFSIYFNTTDGSLYRWFNWSYTITATYAWTYVNMYFPSGVGYPLENFVLYVNGSRIYDRDLKFYHLTDAVYEICVKDHFGAELYNMTHSWARAIDIMIPVYEFSVSHMLTTTFIDFELTGPNGQKWSTIIHPNDVVRFYLFSSGRYTYEYSGIFNASSDATPDYKTYTGEIVDISEDCGIVIVSWGVDKILYEIAVKPTGGGGVSVAEMNTLMTNVVGNLQATYIILAVLIIGANMIIVVLRGGSSDTFVKVSSGKPPSQKQDSDRRRSNRPPKEHQYGSRTYDPTSRLGKRRMKQ